MRLLRQFLENELSFEGLPLTELLWPQPYWEAVLLLVAALAAWAFSFGLSWLESLLLTGLAGFTLVTGALFHSNFADQIQMVMFLKNVSIAGALLMLVANGAGRLSLDRLRAKGD